jgi:hypothetical protein
MVNFKEKGFKGAQSTNNERKGILKIHVYNNSWNTLF